MTERSSPKCRAAWRLLCVPLCPSLPTGAPHIPSLYRVSNLLLTKQHINGTDSPLPSSIGKERKRHCLLVTHKHRPYQTGANSNVLKPTGAPECTAGSRVQPSPLSRSPPQCLTTSDRYLSACDLENDRNCRGGCLALPRNKRANKQMCRMATLGNADPAIAKPLKPRNHQAQGTIWSFRQISLQPHVNRLDI